MRTEMVFDGGRLHILPLKEISTALGGSPSVENGWEPAGGITSASVEVTSLEIGDMVSGAMDVDPDGTSASIDLGSVGPGRLLVSGKFASSNTGTSEVFGGFTYYHTPFASSASPAARTAAPAIAAVKKAFSRACLVVAALTALAAAAHAAEPERKHVEKVIYSETDAVPPLRVDQPCECGPDCECGADCRCESAALFAVADKEATAAKVAAGRSLRRTAMRIALKSQARKVRRAGDAELASKIQAVLDDDEAMADLDAALLAESISYRAVGEFPDGLLKILDWFRENGDWLIAFIKQIIDMLVAQNQIAPPATWADVPAGWQELPLATAC